MSIVEKNKGLTVKPKLLKETSLFTSLEMDKGVESECLPLPTMVTSLDAVGRECQSYIVISTAQSDTQPKKYSRRSILLQGNFKFDMVDD